MRIVRIKLVDERPAPAAGLASPRREVLAAARGAHPRHNYEQAVPGSQRSLRHAGEPSRSTLLR